MGAFYKYLVAGALIVPLCAQGATDQKITSSVKPHLPPEKEVDTLLSKIGGLPAEYKADLGFTILNADWQQMPVPRRREILDQIFISAPSAKYATTLIYAARNSDSTASQVNHNLIDEPLDTLEIQTKVVMVSLPSMPIFASQEFSRIQPKFGRSSCADPSVADLSAYYTTALAVLKNPAIEQIGGNRKDFFLQQIVNEAAEPQRLVPLIALLSQIDIPDSERPQIVAALIHNFDAGEASDREMTALALPLSANMAAFTTHLKDAGVADDRLLASYRSFLVRSLTGAACSDLSADRKRISNAYSLISISVQPLSEIDLKSTTTGGKAVDPVMSLDKTTLHALQRLNAIKQTNLRSASQDEANDSQIDASDVQIVLKSAASPTSVAESCALCDFESRAFQFFMLTESLPAGQYLATTLGAEADFLSFNHIEEEDPPAYLNVLSELINISRPVTDKTKGDLESLTKMMRSFQGSPSMGSEAIRKQLRASNDRIIQAYMTFEDLFKPVYELPPAFDKRLQERNQ
jgi:hypothetical protein